MASPLALLVASVLAFDPQVSPQTAPAAPSPSIAIDVVTVPSGIPVAPAELSVTVDGRTRKVLSVAPIFRGPGSERAATESATRSVHPVAEQSRIIVVLVDQNSLARGSEKKTSAMLARVLELIGPADRAALIPLPLEGATPIAIGTDRGALWSALARIRVGSAAAPLALARAEQPAPLPDDEAHEIRSPSGEERPGSEERPTPQRDRQPGLARDADARSDVAERKPGILGDVRSILSAIRATPESKTVLVVRGTFTPGEAEGRQELARSERLESAGVAEAAAEARATLNVVTLNGGQKAGDEVVRVSRATGGDEFRLGKQADKELERLGISMAEGLRVVVEGSPEVLDGRSHQIAVTATRRDILVRAPERWLPFEIREPERMTTSQPAAPPTGASVPAGAADRASSATATDPEFRRVLARMSSYVAQYVQEFSSVVAEERYAQNVRAQGAWRVPGAGSRELRSDFLLVQIPGTNEDWSPFRDVFEVNGKPVRERDDRLRKLFIEMPPDALDKARRILDESARYNIGTTYRNVNLPVLALIFLKPQFVGGLQFSRGGDDTVEGVHVWRIDFEEIGHPTVIRNDRADRDIPATGSLWVDPITGRIVKTRIKMSDATVRMDTTVLYRRSDALHLWAPAEMEEIYISGVERLTGRATYKNFRRFRVDVEEQIAVPKS